ncbi:MAG: ABC transporter six-transmembrane domain-containing protein, partial [Chloroflexota bacterium]
IASVFFLIVYGVSGRHNFNLNKGYNDELERQVDVLTSTNKQHITQHFQSVMRWNIKLSDFETFKYSLVWLSMIGLLLYAVYSSVDSGLQDFGTIFSLVVYVFEFIGSVVALPLYIQQLIRLREISSRLS